MINAIENRNFRNELIGQLMDLSNKELQRDIWCDPKAAHPFWDHMRFSIGFLLDDLGFCDEHPEVQIGNILYDENELSAVLVVAFALRRIIDEIGIQQPNSRYTDSPLWWEVVEKSRMALEIMQQNDAQLVTIKRIQ